MSDTKWTPGPWVAIIGKCGDHAGYVHSIKRSDRGSFPIVADIVERTRDGTHEANARIIAAAPELYEALKSCLAELESLNKSIGWRDGEWNQVTIARAAIAKARGENNG